MLGQALSPIRMSVYGNPQVSARATPRRSESSLAADVFIVRLHSPLHGSCHIIITVADPLPLFSSFDILF